MAIRAVEKISFFGAARAAKNGVYTFLYICKEPLAY